jgi:transposase
MLIMMNNEQCKNCPLIEEIAKLRAEIDALKKELEKYEKPPKNSSNSSMPPSSDLKKKYSQREKTGRKTGGQAGHEGITRMLSENPDEIIPIYPIVCPHCNSVDFELIERVKERRQEVDIPKIQPVITEYQQKAGICTCCGKRSLGEFPQRINAPIQIGERTEAIVGYLHVEHHQSYDRVQRILTDLFGLEISEGTVKSKLDNLKTLLEPEYNNILENLKNSSVIGSDTTGTRIESKNAQLWTFQNKFYTYLKSGFSKAFKIIEEIIGKEFQGYWISDRDPTQLKVEALHQLCNSHLIRDCRYAIEAYESRWAKILKQILQDSISFRKKRGNEFNPLEPDDFRESQKFKQRLEELFQKPPPDEERKLFNALGGRQDQILMFLNNPAVPYDNNGSERALRNRVIHRKVTGGFRTFNGAYTHDVIASVIETAKKQGRNILDEIISISRQNQTLLSS